MRGKVCSLMKRLSHVLVSEETPPHKYIFIMKIQNLDRVTFKTNQLITTVSYMKSELEIDDIR